MSNDANSNDYPTHQSNAGTPIVSMPVAKWLPMDRAPKDGREVILKVKSRAGVPNGKLIGHYQPGGHCIEDHPPIAQGWYFWNGRMFDVAAEPIGWMHIPTTEDD
jgi:hypothetical protein